MPTSSRRMQARFEQVYERHFEYVCATMRRLGVHATHVDDAVQDLFIAVHRRLPEFEGRSSVKTWLFHFMLRMSAAYRRRLTNRTLFEHAMKREPLVLDFAPDEVLEARQRTALMRRLLGELSADERAVFELVECEDETVASASQRLRLNENTCATRLRKARRAFDAAIAREQAREDWRIRWWATQMAT